MCNVVKVMLGNVALRSGSNLLLIHYMSWGKAENKWHVQIDWSKFNRWAVLKAINECRKMTRKSPGPWK